MASVNLDEIKLEDIDFEKVKGCTDKRVIKRYIKLIDEDGNYFPDLLKACKEKLLEIAPTEYWLLYPRVTSTQEIDDANQDILEWAMAVKGTDQALKNAKKNQIFDTDGGYKVSAPIRGQEPLVARPDLQKEPVRNMLDEPRRKEDVFARDKSNMKDYYSAWDKVDIDALEEEMDAGEREIEEQRRRHFEDLREKQDAAHAFAPIKVTGTEVVPEAHRKHMADSEKEKGNEAFYAKDFEEAEAFYTRSLRYKADDPSTWANRALVRLKQDNAQGALEDCEHALAINPRYMKGLHRKGKALFELGRYEQAVKSFQLALAESPGNTQINGDLMVARRKSRSDPGPPVSKLVSRSPFLETTCRIEELDPETEKPLSQAKPPAPRPNYTRVVIEEESDSEGEENDGGNAQGFRKIQIEEVEESDAEEESDNAGFRKVEIEEVSGSEDEDEDTGSGAGAPAMDAQAPVVGAGVRVAEAQAPVAGFEDMD